MFDNFVKYLIAQARDQKTINSYLLNIELFMRYMKDYKELDIVNLEEFELITPEDIEEYMIYLQTKPSKQNKEGNKPATINLKLTAIRQLYMFLLKRNIVSSNPMDEIRNLTIPYEEQQYLTVDEAFKMIAATERMENKRDCNRFRDALIIKLFLYCGLRLSELASLKFSDLENREYIKITGKRQKVRYPALNEDILDSYDKFIKYKEETNKFGDYICSKTTGNQLTKEAVGLIVIKYANLAGLEKKIHAHTLRHAYASMTAQTVSALELMRLMGHSSLATTNRYFHMDAERSKAIAKKNPLLNKVKSV